MSASSSAAAGGAPVVTVRHLGRTAYRILPPLSETEPVNPAENYRGRATPFGMVQAFTGLTVLLLESLVVSGNKSFNLSSSSGAFIWQPVMSVIAGFLTLAAGRSLSRSVVRCAVHFNVAAALTSVAATAIFFVDASGVLNSVYDPFDPDGKYTAFNTMLSGVSGVLSFLGFSLSMNLVMCSCSSSVEPTVQLITVTNQVYEGAPVPVETPPTNPTPPTQSAPPLPDEKPPSYSSIMN